MRILLSSDCPINTIPIMKCTRQQCMQQVLWFHLANCSSNWSELSKEGKTRKKQKMIEHHQDVVAGGGGLAGGAGRDSGQHGQVRCCDRGAPISSKRVRIFFDGTGSVAATPVVG
ncbi:hypothetical protein ZWY2020_032158 [Hordeum vulgare]|nr:hypothetical protein ZWY2020_032158 [Hordeum vulgare]